MLIEKNDSSELLNELTALIEETKTNVATYVNNSLTLLFWHIGNRILDHILQNKRAEYGKQIVVTVSRELVKRFGNNYEEKNLRRMIQFAEKYTDFENVVTLSRHLSWSHFLALMELYLKWLNKYERQQGEESPIGLLLCAVASKEQIELLEMHKDGIMVAEFWTDGYTLYQDIYVINTTDISNQTSSPQHSFSKIII